LTPYLVAGDTTVTFQTRLTPVYCGAQHMVISAERFHFKT